ncbi:MAG: hypothetical protein Q8L24_00870, partial [bacterium]|nr:hypothetical protein [bacterium]
WHPTEKQASAVFDILVEEAGAANVEGCREEFIYIQTSPEHAKHLTEFSFFSELGGAKIWRSPRGFWVTSSKFSARTERIIGKCHDRLKALGLLAPQ